MDVSQETIDMFAHATDGFQMHSVDDKLNGLTRLVASKDCAALDVVAGEEYLLFAIGEGFAFRAIDANENVALAGKAVYGLDRSSIGTNYDDSRARIAIRSISKEVCRFVQLPSR